MILLGAGFIYIRRKRLPHMCQHHASTRSVLEWVPLLWAKRLACKGLTLHKGKGNPQHPRQFRAPSENTKKFISNKLKNLTSIWTYTFWFSYSIFVPKIDCRLQAHKNEGC